MLDILDRLGVADDTIVVYSTDNGPHMNTDTVTTTADTVTTNSDSMATNHPHRRCRRHGHPECRPTADPVVVGVPLGVRCRWVPAQVAGP
jgi:arylsulfatase A-like enzyme